MATASHPQGKFTHLLECTICLDTFKRPKALPCGHTYCASCLQSHINSKLTQNGTRQASFPCPVCMAITAPPDPTIGTDKWAELFPVNSMVVSLLDLKVDIPPEKHCDLCLKRKKETPAVSYCRECKISMCVMCQEYHDDISACNKVKTFGLNNLNDIPPNLAFIEMCSKHSTEHIKFFCSEHNTMVCSICGFLEHRKCETIITLDEMMTTFGISVMTKEAEANLKQCHSNLEQVMSVVTGNIDTLDKDKAAITKQIRSLITQLNNRLRWLEIDLDYIMDTRQKSEKLNIQFQKTKAHSLKTAIETDLIQIDLVMTHGSDAQKFIMHHKLNQNQKRYLDMVTKFQNDLTCARMMFDVDKTFRDLVNKLCTLGKINMSRTKVNISSFPTGKAPV